MGATIDFDAIATGTNPLAGHFGATATSALMIGATISAPH
jgi:hypothetical protein